MKETLAIISKTGNMLKDRKAQSIKRKAKHQNVEKTGIKIVLRIQVTETNGQSF